MKDLRDKNHVRQHNYNVFRMPKLGFYELRLYYAILAMVTGEDTTDSEFKVSVNDFCDLYNLNPSGVYTEIKNTADTLIKKQFRKFRYNSKGKEISFEIENLIQRVEYTFGDPTVSIWLGKTSLEYAKKDENGREFNYFVIKNIASLSGENAVRFYILMNMWKRMGKKEMPLLEFKDLMWLSDKYISKKTGEINNTGFVQAVIKPCEDEINKKTNLNVKCMIGKQYGRRRTIEFKINEKLVSEIPVATEIVAEARAKETDNVTVMRWPRLGIRRNEVEYFMLMNLVKEDSPASWYGDKPGAYKVKERYLDYYLGQAEWMMEQDPLLTKEEAITMLKKMLKEDSDQRTFYKRMELQGFDGKTEKEAHERACRQIVARKAGIEQYRKNKLEKDERA